MRAELDEVSVYIAKNTDKNISMSEKMTQTDWHMFDRHFSGAESTDYKTTPNGTSPCNHPSLSCQVSCPNFCIKVHSLDDALTYAFMWCSKVKNPILSSPSLHFSNANSNCFHFSRHLLTPFFLGNSKFDVFLGTPGSFNGSQCHPHCSISLRHQVPQVLLHLQPGRGRGQEHEERHLPFRSRCLRIGRHTQTYPKNLVMLYLLCLLLYHHARIRGDVCRP